MKLISFYISCSSFVSIFLMIYLLAIILLLTGTFFKNRIKSESYNLLYVFNTLAAWCSLFVFLAYIVELFMVWYDQWYGFRGGTSEYRTWIFIINLLFFLLGLLLFFRKLRINRWFTLLFSLSVFGFRFRQLHVRVDCGY